MAARVLSDVARSGRERLGPRPRQSAIKIGRLLPRRQRLLATSQIRQHGGEIVERACQIGRERLGPRPRQSAIKIGRLLRRRQRLLATP